MIDLTTASAQQVFDKLIEGDHDVRYGLSTWAFTKFNLSVVKKRGDNYGLDLSAVARIPPPEATNRTSGGDLFGGNYERIENDESCDMVAWVDYADPAREAAARLVCLYVAWR